MTVIALSSCSLVATHAIYQSKNTGMRIWSSADTLGLQPDISLEFMSSSSLRKCSWKCITQVFPSEELGDSLLGQDRLQMQFGKTHLEKLSACRMLFPWMPVGQSKALDESESELQLHLSGQLACSDLSEGRVPARPPLAPCVSQRA